MADPALYRPCVGLMLFRDGGLVFVGQRTDAIGAWQMPQGGIDEGETPREAALRELHEEVGTDKATIVAESRDWHYYDLPPALAARMWGGRYRGQRQKWFALRFLGSDADINVATAHPEFSAWKWAHIDELLDLIVPFKRDVYSAVVAELAPVVRAR
jgi:putative (di)nucleoside polyphosphate hydrolase